MCIRDSHYTTSLSEKDKLERFFCCIKYTRIFLTRTFIEVGILNTICSGHIISYHFDITEWMYLLVCSLIKSKVTCADCIYPKHYVQVKLNTEISVSRYVVNTYYACACFVSVVSRRILRYSYSATSTMQYNKYFLLQCLSYLLLHAPCPHKGIGEATSLDAAAE